MKLNITKLRAFCGGQFGIYGYAMSRFLAGAGGIGGFVTAFVLAVEHAGSRFTMLIGVAIMIPFSMGLASLGLAAYLVRDWKLLQIIIHLPLLGRRRSVSHDRMFNDRADLVVPSRSRVSQVADQQREDKGSQGDHN